MSQQFNKAAIEKARKTVVSFLHYKGSKCDVLTTQEWITVYVNGDGFGFLTRTQARKMDYDWSHVRDSSDQAIVDMHDTIIECLEHRLDWIERYNKARATA